MNSAAGGNFLDKKARNGLKNHQRASPKFSIHEARPSVFQIILLLLRARVLFQATSFATQRDVKASLRRIGGFPECDLKLFFPPPKETENETRGQEVLQISESGNPTSTSGLTIDSRSPSFTPFGGSDFLMEEIDAFLEHDDSIPPGVDGIYDSEGDTVYLEELLSVINSDPNLPPSPVCEINVPEKGDEQITHAKVAKNFERNEDKNRPDQGSQVTQTCHSLEDFLILRDRSIVLAPIDFDGGKMPNPKVQHHRRVNPKPKRQKLQKVVKTPILVLNWERCTLWSKERQYPWSSRLLNPDLSPRATKTKHFQPIHYASKTMTEAQAHYTTTEKELLAVVYAFEKVGPISCPCPKSIVITGPLGSHVLCLLSRKSKAQDCTVCDFVLLLQEFDAAIQIKKGAENHLAADHLLDLKFPSK
ncbi:reverse transcriptase domain-containing protein [Tanacetum coccineum]